MDDIKDIKKTDNLSRFLDAHAVRTNPFGENRAADRAYRKAERICAAIYLLTNHISENESLRLNVRAQTNELLSDILSIRDVMRSSTAPVFQMLQARLRHIISLLRILSVSGNVSQQNAVTMIEAVDDLGSFIVASQRSILSEQYSFTREELIDVHVPSVSQRAPASRVTKDNTSFMQVAKVSNTGSVGNDALPSVRVQSILEILKVGGSLGIKDIAANLPEYSEKMIQRELLDMVSRSLVRKIGLKRWSRYSINA